MLIDFARVSRPPAAVSPQTVFGPQPQFSLCDLRDLCAMLSPFSHPSRDAVERGALTNLLTSEGVSPKA
jgi:hypothetical protein